MNLVPVQLPSNITKADCSGKQNARQPAPDTCKMVRDIGRYPKKSDENHSYAPSRLKKSIDTVLSQD